MKEKKLYRSSTDQMLGGVAAGMADYLETDTTIIRLFWGLSFLAGFGIPAYLIAWVIIPLDSSSKSQKTGAEEIKEKAQKAAKEIEMAVNDNMDNGSDGKVQGKTESGTDFKFWLGIIIIFFAISLLMQNLFGSTVWRNFWPILLMAFGLVLIVKNFEKKE